MFEDLQHLNCVLVKADCFSAMNLGPLTGLNHAIASYHALQNDLACLCTRIHYISSLQKRHKRDELIICAQCELY